MYYPAGLISLIFLPLFCITYFHKHHAFEELRVLEVVSGNRNALKDAYIGRLHPERNFVDINLTADDESNRIKLAFAELEINQIIKNLDTLKGIHFHFNSDLKYKTLVKVFSLCSDVEEISYSSYEDEIWIYHVPLLYPPDDLILPFQCGTSNFRIINLPENETNYLGAAKKLFLPGLLFMAMIVFATKRKYFAL